ncbi:MAG: signal peptidase I [Anaerostipes sp.]|jgi:signal peptidase I|nr:signal peptidase I [Anaerostipes sp.]MDD3745296.1 signal peptidase I [Anaerostipes sp.]
MAAYRVRHRKSESYHNILFYVITVVVSFVLVSGFLFFVGYRTVVNGESMEPTLRDEDNVIVDKISYRLHKEKRYDVIVFHKPEDEKTYLVKRLIGFPGERILIRDGIVYINGKSLEKDTSLDGYTIPFDMEKEITVPKNCYFVLGDNRYNSMDSRDHRIGFISKDNVVGKVVFRIYPFSKFGKIQ